MSQNFNPGRENCSSGASSAARSSIGATQFYEGGDQRNITKDEVHRVTRESGHNLRGYMANYSRNQEPMATAVGREKERIKSLDEAELMKRDPTRAATMQGNEPSRGAKIDAELMAEDEEELRRKGKI